MRSRVAICWLLLSAPLPGDTFGSGDHEFTIDFVTIGAAGNSPDGSGFGAVDHEYRMAVHEISRTMIESFNALSEWQSITMTDMSASGGNGGDRPATGISWEEAVRFVDWLNTSEGYGKAYSMTTTGTPYLWTVHAWGYDAENPVRNSRARYFLPTEDEWYKAAYHDAMEDGFLHFPTGSNSAPVAVVSGTVDGTAVFDLGSLPGAVLAPADVTEAGGLSSHGTVGQGGNAWEWTETNGDRSFDTIFDGRVLSKERIIRGGCFASGADELGSDVSDTGFAWYDDGSSWERIGFRVASTTESVALDPIEITTVTRGLAGGLILQWSGPRGFAYLQYSPRLDPADWSCVAVPMHGDSGEIMVSHPPAGGGYYRLMMPPDNRADLAARLQMELLEAQMENFNTDHGFYPEARDSKGLIIYKALFGDGLGADGIPGTSDDIPPDGRTDDGAKVYLPVLDPTTNPMHLLDSSPGGIPTGLVDPYGNWWEYTGGERYHTRMHNTTIDLYSKGGDGEGVSSRPGVDDIMNW